LSELLRDGLCVHSQQHTHMSSSYWSSRLGLSHWDVYTMHSGGCLELYYCNMVEWSWWDSSLIWKTNWFFFSALTLLVWSYNHNVFGGMLNFAQSINSEPHSISTAWFVLN